MSEIIEKELQPTVKLLYSASRKIFHLGKSSWFFYGFFLGLPTFLVAYKLAFSTLRISDIYIFLGCTFYVFALTPALSYWAARKSLLSNPSSNQTIKFVFSEKGLRNYGSGLDVNIGWEKITKLLVTKEFLLFYISHNCAYYIPTDLLSQQEIERIKGWKNCHA